MTDNVREYYNASRLNYEAVKRAIDINKRIAEAEKNDPKVEEKDTTEEPVRLKRSTSFAIGNDIINDISERVAKIILEKLLKKDIDPSEKKEEEEEMSEEEKKKKKKAGEKEDPEKTAKEKEE